MGGEDRLNIFAFGRFIESVVQALQGGPPCAEGIPKAEMEIAVPRKALQIIEDDDEVFIRTLIHEGKQGHHPRTFCKVAATRHGTGKDRYDVIASQFSMLAAPRFLAFKAIPIGLLTFR